MPARIGSLTLVLPFIGRYVDGARPSCNNDNVMDRRRLLALSALLLVSPGALAVVAGELAPALALPDAAGRIVDLGKLRGSVVYVDFWASWCPPCKRSFPWMNEMAQKYGAKGLTIVAVNVDKYRENAEKFLKLLPAEFTVVFDPDGKSPATWQVFGMPTAYLVDASGKVVLVDIGFREERKGEIEERIRAALAAR